MSTSSIDGFARKFAQLRLDWLHGTPKLPDWRIHHPGGWFINPTESGHQVQPEASSSDSNSSKTLEEPLRNEIFLSEGAKRHHPLGLVLSVLFVIVWATWGIIGHNWIFVYFTYVLHLVLIDNC